MKLSFDQRSYVFWIVYGVLLLATILICGLGGMLLGYAIDLPQVEELRQIRPNVVSYVYAADGRVLGEFALEKRILVTYEQIPDMIKEAILAAEDDDFFEHQGVHFRRFFTAMARNLMYGQLKGASTLTMQLCKLRFTGTEKTIERKIKDMLFAMETEKTFSKEQIFELYFNQIYMGHGIYGIAAAADFFFGKKLDELSLAESALLAGCLNVPERYSPIRHPARALTRRAYTLRRMHEEGYIDQDTMDAANQEPLLIPGKDENDTSGYFVEWVRRHLEKNYSTEKIWQGGLKIYTTLDYDLQVAAYEAMRKGLKEFDKKTPWEGPEANLVDEGKNIDEYYHPEWRRLFRPGDLIHGLVTAVDENTATVKFGSYTALLGPEQVAWTKKKKLDQVFQVGDIAAFSIGELDHLQKTLDAELDRIPEIQGGFLSLDNSSGAILAMVGGFDFRYSKFNRSTQALRQPGSIFKPFTYVVAVEEGRSPFDKLLDAPFYHVDELGRPYEPKNNDEKYKGLIPLQQALAESRNVPTIRLAKALGIEKVIEAAHRFGIERQFVPVLPIALGAGEITLQEITSAFSTFANRGVRAEPYFVRRVEDYNGQTLEEHQTEFKQVISPEVSGQMLYLLQQVVQVGTAQKAKVLNRPMAGKTGTTNESMDNWFVGLLPQITAGVWVGYDEKKSLGERVYGATTALPIWIDFMNQVEDKFEPIEFEEVWEPTPQDLARSEIILPEGEAQPESISVEDIPPPGTNIEEEEEGEEGKPPPAE